MSGDFSDDMRQAFVVTKNEFVKYVRGKKIIILGALVLLVWGLVTVLPFLLNMTVDSTYMTAYVSFVSLFVLLIGTLFASGAIVSEFEERTALVVFTRPIKKWPIFIGKFIAALALGVAFTLIYYALSAASVLAFAGSLPDHVLMSLAFALVYLFAVTGVAMMFSSLVKKAGTAAILTFFFLLLITNIIYSILIMNNIEPWFIIDYVSAHISDAFTYGTTVAPSTSMPAGPMTILRQGYDPAIAASVGMVWGFVTLAISYILMRIKEI